MHTARLLPNLCDEGQVVPLYRESILFPKGGCYGFCYGVYGNYTLVYEGVSDGTFFEIRRTCTFELINTVEVSVPRGCSYFKYRNGLLATISRAGSPIR